MKKGDKVEVYSHTDDINPILKGTVKKVYIRKFGDKFRIYLVTENRERVVVESATCDGCRHMEVADRLEDLEEDDETVPTPILRKWRRKMRQWGNGD
ncbi:MAG: hypothetical protein U9R75_10545 [Candidatus Thermoplasmatota archaeon]|nr:hypothetical protein [Candidatus Thermoplasmatota archaeon]